MPRSGISGLNGMQFKILIDKNWIPHFLKLLCWPFKVVKKINVLLLWRVQMWKELRKSYMPLIQRKGGIDSGFLCVCVAFSFHVLNLCLLFLSYLWKYPPWLLLYKCWHSSTEPPGDIFWWPGARVCSHCSYKSLLFILFREHLTLYLRDRVRSSWTFLYHYFKFFLSVLSLVYITVENI